MELPFRRHHLLAERLRTQDAAGDAASDAGSRPSHAFQKAATVYTVVVVIVNDFLRQVSPHVDGLSCSTGFHTRTGQALFQQALKLFAVFRGGNNTRRRTVLSGVARSGQ